MKGIYCLTIDVKKNINPKIGALGKLPFQKGKYVYVGSAQNNLKKRIKRHLSKNKNIRWHIDYLLKNPDTKIEKVFYKNANKQEECKTASFLFKLEEPIKNFGCSDCNCNSHLFKIKSLKNINKLKFKNLK